MQDLARKTNYSKVPFKIVHASQTFYLILIFSILIREFYYIQMEKYARQLVSEGVKIVEDIHINGESEIYRVLNLHYNRNNHIEVDFVVIVWFAI